MCMALHRDFRGPDRSGPRSCDDNPVSIHSEQNNCVNVVHSRNSSFPKPGDLVYSNEGDMPEETDDSDAVLKFISHILLEEELDSKASMSQDVSALKAFEKSLYDVLGQKSSPSRYKAPLGSDLDNITAGSDNTTLFGPTTILNPNDFNCVHADNPILISPSESKCWPLGTRCVTVDSNISKCREGLDEASQAHTLPPTPYEDALKEIQMVEKVGRKFSSHGSRGRKNNERQNTNYLEEERSSKHSAFYLVETPLSDMFDKLLLSDETAFDPTSCNIKGGSSQDESKKLWQKEQLGGQMSMSKKGKKQKSRGTIDFTRLLFQCAEAVASCDQKAAHVVLKQIKLHSSPSGDAQQRLAHVFANGLEARLAGIAGQEVHGGCYLATVSKRPASDFLKAYHAYISVCPFFKVSHLFAARTIVSLSVKETKLHIIDFGILYGFQWPILIHLLSKRPGGPPKLRITGIEIPHSGYRPAERAEEAGHHLADYCRRYNVPFEYYPIARKWETIRVEDIKIDNDEFLVVNCLYRCKQLLDETVIARSPKDAVLDLIRKNNPKIFIHGIVNGVYASPFFFVRFREALFHFSALFDIFETCFPREDEARMIIETEIYGREAMNVIACEGTERIERPESYKMWQVRNLRAGFRQIPLNQDILKEIRAKVMLNYHRDFGVDEDSHWLLQGWKGRIIYALSCWKPS